MWFIVPDTGLGVGAASLTGVAESTFLRIAQVRGDEDFEFLLPGEGEMIGPRGRSRGHGLSTSATILLIEDHRATRTFLADNLSADGFDVLEAETASEARRISWPAPSPTSRSSTSAFPTATVSTCWRTYANPIASRGVWTRTCLYSSCPVA